MKLRQGTMQLIMKPRCLPSSEGVLRRTKEDEYQETMERRIRHRRAKTTEIRSRRTTGQKGMAQDWETTAGKGYD